MLRALLMLVTAGFGVIAYASLIERNAFAVRRHRIPCLPPGRAPMNVLHISDLHLRSVQRRKHRFLRGLVRLKPDLIVGTGDFLGDAVSVPATVETMNALRGAAPALFVLGSNDYYSPVFKNPLRYLKKKKGKHIAGGPNPWEDLVAGLERGGWTFANNVAMTLDDIDVVGLDDAHIHRADLSVASPRTAPGFRLAVAHSPDVARALDALDYDLIVCGHTHGGQIRIPGYGAIITNCSLPREMASGAHRLTRAWLHVSGGLGTSMFAPYRLACRPEVCILELVEAGA